MIILFFNSLATASSGQNKTISNSSSTPKSQHETRDYIVDPVLNAQTNMSNFAKIKHIKTSALNKNGEININHHQKGEATANDETSLCGNEMDLLNDWDSYSKKFLPNTEHNEFNSSGHRPKTRMGFQANNSSHLSNGSISQFDLNNNNKQMSNQHNHNHKKQISEDNFIKYSDFIHNRNDFKAKDQKQVKNNSNGAHTLDNRALLNDFETNRIKMVEKLANENESVLSDNLGNSLKFDDASSSSYCRNGVYQNGNQKSNGNYLIFRLIWLKICFLFVSTFSY